MGFTNGAALIVLREQFPRTGLAFYFFALAIIGFTVAVTAILWNQLAAGKMRAYDRIRTHDVLAGRMTSKEYYFGIDPVREKMEIRINIRNATALVSTVSVLTLLLLCLWIVPAKDDTKASEFPSKTLPMSTNNTPKTGATGPDSTKSASSNPAPPKSQPTPPKK